MSEASEDVVMPIEEESSAEEQAPQGDDTELDDQIALEG